MVDDCKGNDRLILRTDKIDKQWSMTVGVMRDCNPKDRQIEKQWSTTVGVMRDCIPKDRQIVKQWSTTVRVMRD